MSKAGIAALVGLGLHLLFLGWLYGLGHHFDEGTARALMFGPLALPLAYAIPIGIAKGKALAGLAFLAGGGLTIVLAIKVTSPVLVVSPVMQAERGIVFRAASVLGIDVAALGGGFGGALQIVNASSTSLRLTSVVYGYGEQSDGYTSVAPRSIRRVDHEIDYLGPDDAPPEAITSQSFSEAKHWLTW